MNNSSPLQLAVIINPNSGSNDSQFNAALHEALEKSGCSFVCLETDPERGAEPAVERALELGATTIAACGGDGTVMSAINALGARDSTTELAIIPGGTANLLAAALAIPSEPEKALAVALEGQTRHVDLGECGDTLFALGLGLGLTEKLVSQASTQEKETLGKLAYAKAMLREVGARPHNFSFRLDDGPSQSARGVGLVIANAGDIGGDVKFAPDAQMDDGRLDLVILHRFDLADVVRLVFAGLWGDVRRDRAVSFFQAAQIAIESDPPLDLQIDGEEVETKPPLLVRVRPGALRVKVPNAEQSEKTPVEAVAQAATSARFWPVALLAALFSVGALVFWKRRR